MKISYPIAEVPNPGEALRKAGYAYFRDPKSGEDSFVIRLTTEFYPRFHLYVDQDDKQVSFNLHLDQKKPSYGDHNKHAGEYDGEVVSKEMRRVDSWVRSYARMVKADNITPASDRHKTKDASKPWWRRFF
ncbi:MAG: hypothetical protein WAZ14_02960 [Patescibacteria group bacterium]